MILKNLKNKNFEKLKKIMLVFISISLSILTLKPFFISADISLIVLTFFILILIYFFIFKSLIKIYFRIAEYLIFKLNNTKLKDTFNKLVYIFIFPVLLFTLVNIIIFIISEYYMWIEINTLGNVINYEKIVINLTSFYFPIVILVFLFLLLVTQLYSFVKIEKIRFFPALLSSFLTILIFSFIVCIIRNIFVVILA